MFYVNLIVTAKQKPIVDTQEVQNSKHTTTENYQVTKERAREEEKNKELQNSQKKQLTKWKIYFYQ